MKHFQINKKRLGIIIIIIGLIMILLGFESLFHKNIKNAVFVENDMGRLQEQIILDGDVAYSMPNDWIREEKEPEKNHILYHSDFTWNDYRIKGYIEVWQNNIALDTFMTSTKSTALRNKEYKNYDSRKTKISSMDAYEVSYIQNDNEESYDTYEYYINGEDYVIKLIFLTPENVSNKSYTSVFKALAEKIVMKN